MSERLFRAWGAGCGRALLIRLAATIGVLAILAVCMVIVALVPLPRRLDRQILFMVAFIGAIFISVFGALIIGLLLRSRRLSELDAAFVPLGLSAHSHLITGRQYHGMWQGRQVDAYFSRGPTLEVYVSANARTRMGIGSKNRIGSAVAGMRGQAELDSADPAFESLALYAVDTLWGQSLLANSEARAAILRLMHAQGAYDLRTTSITPDAIYLQLRYVPLGRISEENVRQWLSDLIAIARAAETIPPPAQPATSHSLETRARIQRDTISVRVMVITVAAFLALGVCMGAFVMLLIALDSL